MIGNRKNRRKKNPIKKTHNTLNEGKQTLMNSDFKNSYSRKVLILSIRFLNKVFSFIKVLLYKKG